MEFIRKGGSQNQMTRTFLIASQLFYPIVLQIQDIVLQVKFINSTQFLSQSTSKLTSKLVKINTKSLMISGH